jgi:hypothetical protein
MKLPRRAGTPDARRDIDPPPAAAPSIPDTSFDFLEGAYRATARTRLLNLVLVGVAVVIVALVGSQALRNAVDSAAVNERNRQVLDETASISTELERQASDGVVTYDQLRAGLDEWALLAAGPTAGVVDAAQVIADLAAASPGVTIRTVTITAPGNADTTAAGSSATPGSRSTTPPPAAASTGAVVLTVEGVTDSSTTAARLEELFKDTSRFGYLSDVAVPFTCSEASCSFSLTATVDPAKLPQRSDAIAGRLLETLPENRR